LIVDLDVLNIGELFEVCHKRARDGIQRAVGLTRAREMDMRNAVCEFEFAVAGETVEHQGKSLPAFDAGRTREIFIEHRSDDVPRGWNIPRDRDFIGEFTADQPVVIGEVHINLHV